MGFLDKLRGISDAARQIKESISAEQQQLQDTIQHVAALSGSILKEQSFSHPISRWIATEINKYAKLLSKNLADLTAIKETYTEKQKATGKQFAKDKQFIEADIRTLTQYATDLIAQTTVTVMDFLGKPSGEFATILKINLPRQWNHLPEPALKHNKSMKKQCIGISRICCVILI